jgi:hypothetical protein
MKTKEQIQQAHDIMHALLEYDNEQPEGEKMPFDLKQIINAAHDAVAWSVGSPCGAVFEDNLKMVQEKMDKAGYRFVKRRGEAHSE